MTETVTVAVPAHARSEGRCWLEAAMRDFFHCGMAARVAEDSMEVGVARLERIREVVRFVLWVLDSAGLTGCVLCACAEAARRGDGGVVVHAFSRVIFGLVLVPVLSPALCLWCTYEV